MARKVKRELPREWQEISRESRAHFETNDCAVIAFALAYEISYNDALGLLEDCGRDPRKGTWMITQVLAMEKMKRRFGINWKVIDSAELASVRAKEIRKGKLTGYFWTYNNICQEGIWNDGVYLVYCREHVACMINGRILDHAINSKRIVLKLVRIERDSKEDKSIFD